MIDPLTEDLIPLCDVAKYRPAHRGGKKPHISCIYRWTTSGCKGVVLESIQAGGTRVTSRQAVARFFERLTAAAHNNKPPAETATQRRNELDRTERELDEAGL